MRRRYQEITCDQGLHKVYIALSLPQISVNQTFLAAGALQSISARVPLSIWLPKMVTLPASLYCWKAKSMWVLWTSTRVPLSIWLPLEVTLPVSLHCWKAKPMCMLWTSTIIPLSITLPKVVTLPVQKHFWLCPCTAARQCHFESFLKSPYQFGLVWL
jgi:hypothetical protein